MTGLTAQSITNLAKSKALGSIKIKYPIDGAGDSTIIIFKTLFNL